MKDLSPVGKMGNLIYVPSPDGHSAIVTLPVIFPVFRNIVRQEVTIQIVVVSVPQFFIFNPDELIQG